MTGAVEPAYSDWEADVLPSKLDPSARGYDPLMVRPSWAKRSWWGNRTRKSARSVVTASVLVTSIVLTLAPNGLVQAVGTIVLNPAQGPVGTQVTVMGTGFAPGSPPCQVRFGVAANAPFGSWGGTVVASCTVNGNGGLQATFTVPQAPVGSVTIGVCNYCNGGEFVETAKVTFNVTAPTSTTTLPTTTQPQVTTTVPQSSTTVPPSAPPTTAAPVQPVGLPDPVNGAAVPELGTFLGEDGPWRPIEIVDDLVEVPDRWLDRCSAPSGGQSIDFDDRPVGDTDFFLTSRSESPVAWMFGRNVYEPPIDPIRIVAPTHGTWSAPHALSIALPDFRSRPGGATLPFVAGDSVGPGVRTRTIGFTYIGMRVGLASDHGAPVVVELKSSTSRVIDLDRVVLGPKRTPATSCLIVAAPPGTKLVDVRLSVFTGDGQGADVLIDSVFWDIDQPFPIETPSEIPVRITTPSDGDRLTASRTRTVLGQVIWPTGRETPAVNVAVPTWDRTGVVVRRAELGRPIDDGVSMTAIFWVDGVRIPSGSFEIHATATAPHGRGSDFVTLEGVGPSALPPDDYREALSGEVDVVPWAMEVTQAVRGPLEVQSPGSMIDDNFDHVGGKKTVVRGYGMHRFDSDGVGVAGGTLHVDAVLHATRGGVTLPLSPLHPSSPSVPLRTTEPGIEAENQMRPSTSLTWNFELPLAWTTGDPIELRLEVNPETSPMYIEEASGLDGAANTIGRRVSFRRVGRVGVSVLNVELFWRCTVGMISSGMGPCAGMTRGATVSSTYDLRTLIATARDLWRMWPAPGSTPSYMSMDGTAFPHEPDEDDITIDPSRRRSVLGLSWSDWKDAYHDLYCRFTASPDIVRPPTTRDMFWLTNPPGSPIGVGGCAWLGYRAAFLAAATAATIGQEAGHGYGLLHTSGAHGERGGGDAVLRFAGDHGQLGPPDRPDWGFDTERGVVIDPRAGETGHTHDFMSYGGGTRWISVGTWNHVIKSLANNRDYDDTRGRVMSERERSSRSAFIESSSTDDVADETQDLQEMWLFDGVIADDGTVTLGVPRLIDSTAVDMSTDGEVFVTLLDGSGVELQRVEVEARSAHTHGGSGGRSFQAHLMPDPSARKLVVEVEGGQRTEMTGSGSELRNIVARRQDRTLSVTWESSTSGNDFVLEIRRDGEGWWPIARTDQSGIDIDLSDVPFAGSDWQLRVQSSDGVVVVSDTIDVDLGQPAPVAVIATPFAGERVIEGMVDVSAAVRTIGDSQAVYTWLVDGVPVTEGPTASVPMLTGPRSLTLRVDVGGTTSETSIDVLSVVDTDGDGMDDEWEDRFGFDPNAFDDPSADHDDDGLQDGVEYALNADPTNVDTDEDGFRDGEEHALGSDMLDPTSVPGPQHGADDHDHDSHDHGIALALWIGIGGGVLAAGGGGGLLARRYKKAKKATSGR